jgi:hypothetical protein
MMSANLAPRVAAWTLFSCALLAAAMPVSGIAAAGEPVGDEFAVETSAFPQDQPAVALDSTGARVVAWVGRDEDGSSAVFARYDGHACGDKQPIRFRVSTSPGVAVAFPDVAMSDGGRTVIAWEQRALGNDRTDIMVRRFGQCGEDYGEMRVNALVDRSHGRPAVAVDHDGDYLYVVWDAYAPDHSFTEVRTQRFHYVWGEPPGQEAVVGTVPLSYTSAQPDISVDALRNVAIVWVAAHVGQIHYASPYDPSSERTVHDDSGSVGKPVVVPAANDTFVVAWQSYASDTADVMARRFEYLGEPLGNAFKVNESDNYKDPLLGDQLAIAASALGDFTVTWGCPPRDGEPGGVYARRYDATGAPLGGEFRVDARAGQLAYDPAIGMDADGDFMVAWTSVPPESDTEIHERRFRGPEPVDLSVTVMDVAPVNHGSLFSFRIRMSNNHPGNSYDPVGFASGAKFSFWLSGADFNYADAHCHGSDPVVCDVGPMSHGEQEFWVWARAPATSGIATLRVAVVGDQDDPDSSNNYAEKQAAIVDMLPDALVFEPVVDVPLNSLQISNTVIITGIEVPVRISGGPYSVNGGAFTTQSGTVQEGDQVRLQRMSASTFDTWRSAFVDIGAGSYIFKTKTIRRDTTPDAFALGDIVGVLRGTVVTSNPITVTGINDAASISVAGGSFSVNDGAFTTASGTVTEGQTIRVRHTASAAFSSSISTQLTIGGISGTFTSTTEAQDTIPESFTFPSASDVPRNTVMTSAPIRVAGVNDATSIAVTGGRYSIDSAAFTSDPGTVANGQSIRVQHTSSSDFQTSVGTTLSIGGVSAVFVSTTAAPDTTPDPFGFADRSGVSRSTEMISDEIMVSGINTSATIDVDKGKYSVDGGVFTTRPGLVVNGQRVRVRHVSASDFSTSKTTRLVIGGVNASFTSTTEARDAAPDPFTFVDRSGVIPLAQTTSNSVTVAGINDAVPIAIRAETGGALNVEASYSVNGGSFTAAAGSVVVGDAVVVRVRAPLEPGAIVRVVVTIGEISDTWEVKTAP